MPRTINWVKKIVEYIAKTQYFERHLKDVTIDTRYYMLPINLKKLQLKPLSVSNGESKLKLIVSQNELNTEGHLHVGLITTLVDVTSSWALFSHGNGNGDAVSGVSTNIHVSFFQKIFLGDVLLINAKVSRVEPHLAFLEVVLSKKDSGDVVARGQHTFFCRKSTKIV